MLECYICGRKTREQYFEYKNGNFELKDRCLNPSCRSHDKYTSSYYKSKNRFI